MEKAEKRGRPKTLERETVLQTALMQYWGVSPTDVSIGKICKLTGASKPGIYREFGSDDGLKCAALESYRSLALLPLFDILKQDQSFAAAKAALVVFTTQEREAVGVPSGCLFVAMRAQRDSLGSATGERVDQLRDEVLDAYMVWIETAKSKKSAVLKSQLMPPRCTSTLKTVGQCGCKKKGSITPQLRPFSGMRSR
jgi:AcrR family transcriptional regulator